MVKEYVRTYGRRIGIQVIEYPEDVALYFTTKHCSLDITASSLNAIFIADFMVGCGYDYGYRHD